MWWQFPLGYQSDKIRKALRECKAPPPQLNSLQHFFSTIKCSPIKVNCFGTTLQVSHDNWSWLWDVSWDWLEKGSS